MCDVICQIMICLICPLLILFLIKMDDKTDSDSNNNNNDDNNNEDNNNENDNTRSNKDCCRGCSILVKKIYYFYSAPIVKFCCHSVTMRQKSLRSSPYFRAFRLRRISHSRARATL